MMPSAHGPMTGAATGAGAANVPAKTVPLANSVVAAIAAVVRLIFISILQSSLIAQFSPSTRQRALLPNIYKNARFVSRFRSLLLI